RAGMKAGGPNLEPPAIRSHCLRKYRKTLEALHLGLADANGLLWPAVVQAFLVVDGFDGFLFLRHLLALEDLGGVVKQLRPQQRIALDNAVDLAIAQGGDAVLGAVD